MPPSESLNGYCTAVLDLVDLATRTAVHSVGRSRSHSGLSELSRPAGHVRVVRSPKLRFLVEFAMVPKLRFLVEFTMTD